MKILFIEDSPEHIVNFSKQLTSLGEVVHFKSLQGTLNWLDEHASSVDLVVCDHNILLFENDLRTPTNALDIYFELRMGANVKVPFIHFSADPCPSKYEYDGIDENFYSLPKERGTDLLQFIKDKILK